MTCALALGPARRPRASRRDHPRARRHRPLRRPARDRERERPATSIEEGHHLHGRGRPAARVARIRVDVHPQRRMAPDVCSGLDAGDRRRRDRRASRLDLRRVRFAGHAVRSVRAHSQERRRRCGSSDEHSTAGFRAAGSRGRRNDRPLREVPRRRAPHLLEERCAAAEHIDATVVVVAVGWVANTDGARSRRGRRTKRPAWLHRGGLPASARARRTSSPPATSPGT